MESKFHIFLILSEAPHSFLFDRNLRNFQLRCRVNDRVSYEPCSSSSRIFMDKESYLLEKCSIVFSWAWIFLLFLFFPFSLSSLLLFIWKTAMLLNIIILRKNILLIWNHPFVSINWFILLRFLVQKTILKNKPKYNFWLISKKIRYEEKNV